MELNPLVLRTVSALTFQQCYEQTTFPARIRVHIPHSKLGKLACQAQSVGIFAFGETPSKRGAIYIPFAFVRRAINIAVGKPPSFYECLCAPLFSFLPRQRFETARTLSFIIGFFSQKQATEQGRLFAYIIHRLSTWEFLSPRWCLLR